MVADKLYTMKVNGGTQVRVDISNKVEIDEIKIGKFEITLKSTF